MGTLVNEDGVGLRGVTVYNVRTDEQSASDLLGNFIIAANNFDEVRFIKPGYERVSKKIVVADFTQPLSITLVRVTQDIDEVEIGFKPTGKLETDVKHVGGSKEVKQLKSDMADYLASPSSPEVLAPKPGEFVQPKGPGFSVGKVDSQWDDVDFMKFIIENLGEDFFVQELKLSTSEIQPFIFYIFRNFDRQKILFYGFCPPSDLARFMREATLKVDWYRKNLPNNPPPKKKKRK